MNIPLVLRVSVAAFILFPSAVLAGITSESTVASLIRSKSAQLESLQLDTGQLIVTGKPIRKATIKGIYTGKKSWSLTFGTLTQVVQGGTPTPFAIEIPLTGPETRIEFIEVDLLGNAKRETAKIEFNSFNGQRPPTHLELRPLRFDVSELYIFQSGGRNAYAPALSWSPILVFSRSFFLQGRFGGSFLKYSADGGFFPLLDYEVRLGVSFFTSWSIQAGGGLQSWIDATGGTYPVFSAGIARSFNSKLLWVIDGLFASYSDAFIGYGNAQEFQAGLQLAW